jgi:hypothetical protein
VESDPKNVPLVNEGHARGGGEIKVTPRYPGNFTDRWGQKRWSHMSAGETCSSGAGFRFVRVCECDEDGQRQGTSADVGVMPCWGFRGRGPRTLVPRSLIHHL